jgi:hypothetical protein
MIFLQEETWVMFEHFQGANADSEINSLQRWLCLCFQGAVWIWKADQFSTRCDYQNIKVRLLKLRNAHVTWSANRNLILSSPLWESELSWFKSRWTHRLALYGYSISQQVTKFMVNYNPINIHIRTVKGL